MDELDLTTQTTRPVAVWFVAGAWWVVDGDETFEGGEPPLEPPCLN